MTDALVPERVLPLLRGRFGSPYVYREVCPSTQELLGPGDPEGATAATDEQTAGRGRLGRRWIAPRGRALLVSVLLRPDRLEAAPQLSLVAGLALARAVEEAAGVSCALKWPNDVLVGERKLAGILAEGRAGGVVLGMGLNVGQEAHELPPGDRRAPTSLRVETGRPHDRAELLATLLAALEEAYDLWRGSGLAPLLGELARRDWLAGREVAVGGHRGVAAGIEPDGRLRLARPEGDVLVTSGEVTVR